jgi:pyruvate ferredoxin oxidoreductase gamma subunit
MLIVGRGGEGVVLASQLLAETFARAGFFVQAFPEFKAERRGAPISAFLRWDTERIHRRYKVRACDVLLDISPSPPSAAVLGALRVGGIAIVNQEARLPESAPFHIARVPASRIASEHGVLSSEGRPLGNMAVLGAAVKLLLPEGMPFLEETISERIARHTDANIATAREGYAQVTRQYSVEGDLHFEAPKPAPRERTPLFQVSLVDSRGNQTGGWSLDRPTILAECTSCGVCALFCPEGAVTREDGTMVIDYLHCKGCGICDVVCPVRGALAMEEVPA